MKSKRRNYRGYYYKIEIAPHYDSYTKNHEKDLWVTVTFTKPWLYFFTSYIAQESFFGEKGRPISEIIKEAIILAHSFIDTRIDVEERLNDKNVKALMNANGMDMIVKLDKI